MEPNNHPSRNKAILITVAVFLILGLGYGSYWFFHARFYERTDDAYVDGNQVVVTPTHPGIVLAFSVYDGDYVEEGRLLVQLDTTEALIALSQAEAHLAQTVREVAKMFENVKRDASLLESSNATLIRAGQDYEHRKAVVEMGAVSLEDFEHAAAALHSAFFDYQAKDAQLAASVLAVQNSTVTTHPLVEEAKAALREALVRYRRCQIKAPSSGVVGQRHVQVGEQVPAGKPLLSIIPLDELWITANYKEVQLRDMRIGQPVSVTADIYGDSIIYPGIVEGIGAGTGSVYSLLPPQNATGNWIKIVQRVPVRIGIDQEMLKHHPLRKGLSVETSTDIRNKEGRFIPKEKPEKPVATTSVFADDEKGADELINAIIKANL